MLFKKQKKKSLQDRYPQYKIGRGTYGNPTIHNWGEGACLEIGAFTSIAPGVQLFLGGEHRVDWVTTFPFNVLWEEAKRFTGHPRTKGDIKIGNDVWLATDSMVMSGVTIGDGAVIGARAVITRDIPPYSIAVGNPGTVIKKRFADEIVDRLLRIQWWQWSDSHIQSAMPYLLNNDIEAFFAYAGNSCGERP